MSQVELSRLKMLSPSDVPDDRIGEAGLGSTVVDADARRIGDGASDSSSKMELRVEATLDPASWTDNRFSALNWRLPLLSKAAISGGKSGGGSSGTEPGCCALNLTNADKGRDLAVRKVPLEAVLRSS